MPFEIDTKTERLEMQKRKPLDENEKNSRNFGKQVRMVIVVSMTILFYGINRTMVPATFNQ